MGVPQLAPRGHPCPPPHSCFHAHRIRSGPAAVGSEL